MKQETILSVYERQLAAYPAEKALLTVVDSRLNAVSYDFLSLDEKSNHAAACLASNGCEKGDRVLILLRETVPVWSFFWGAMKLGAVPCVLFPGLGPGGLEIRLRAADACFLVTDSDWEKLGANIVLPETLKKVVLTGKPVEDPLCVNYSETDWENPIHFSSPNPDDDAFIIFTSGTTGTPKPVIHRHAIATPIIRSMKNVLHATAEDVYWCTAHPAWITGTVYGILGPVLCGIPSVQYDGNFHAKRWLPILQDQKISLWYTAPTALRALMREDEVFFREFELSALKQIYSIGEPLGAAVFHWGERIFSQPIYDTWFQTECGTVRIANQPGEKIIPGWMGKAVDDCETVVDEKSQLLLKKGFESEFKEYYNMLDETKAKAGGEAYVTGDLAEMNEDGYLRFAGRADDVINTSGHLVSPVEVEQVLTQNPAVITAAVVGEPDELIFEAPAAFLVLHDGIEWDRKLESTLKSAVNSGVSSYAIPKHFYIVTELPVTANGKISRAGLKKTLL